MEKIKNISFSGLALKLMGWIFVVIGAVSLAFLPEGTARSVLQVISRIGLPIFAFLAVEGFLHTENLERYIITTVIAAVIAEPFYDYACLGVWFDLSSAVNGQNVLFALALGLVQLYFLRFMGMESVGKVVMSLFMVCAASLWAFLLNVHSGVYPILLMAVFYLLREKKTAWNIVTAVASLPWYLAPALSLLPIAKYSGERGNYNKYIFYVLYPAMWIVLALVKLFLF